MDDTMVGRQRLTYETQEDSTEAYLSVSYEPTNVHGAAVEVLHSEYQDAVHSRHERIVLTVAEALLFAEHLTHAARRALEVGDENFCETE